MHVTAPYTEMHSAIIQSGTPYYYYYYYIIIIIYERARDTAGFEWKPIMGYCSKNRRA
jgi:hypothetical protein